MSDPTNRRRERNRLIAQAYRDSQEVLSICLSLGVFVGGGYWLDRRFGWFPIATVLGVAFGITSAGFSLRALLARMDRRSKRSANRSERQSSEDGETSSS